MTPRFLLRLAVLICCGGVSTLSAASIDASFHSPLLTFRNPASRLYVLPDDSFFVYGRFSRLDGVGRAPLVKFQPGGAITPGFRFSAAYVFIAATAVAPNGAVFVAAVEAGNDRRTYDRILKLHADGSLDLSFDAGAGAMGIVSGIAIQPDGKILVGGLFTEFDGQPRSYLVRLNANGSVDETFASPTLGTSGVFFGGDAAGIYSDVLLQTDGKILFAGAFTSVGNVQTLAIARLNGDGTPDPGFTGSGYRLRNATSASGADPLRALLLESDGRILLGGSFQRPNDPPNYATPLLRLNSNGSLALAFQPAGVTSERNARAIAKLTNGDIAVAGSRFSVFQPNGSESPNYPSHSFVPVADKIGVQSSGDMLIAGPRTVDAVEVNGVARLSSAGVLAPTSLGEFQIELAPEKTALRSDGKIVLSGLFFDRVDGVPRPSVARLEPNGSLDAGFDPSSRVESFGGFVLHPDDKLLLFGFNPEAENGFTCERLNGDDSPDESFTPSHDFFEDALLRPDGSYFILRSDVFSLTDGRSVEHLLASGGLDPDFHLGVDLPTVAVVRNNQGEIVRAYTGDNRPLLSYSDGKFLFRYFDASAKYRLARLNTDSSLDSSFATGEVASLTNTTFYGTISNPRPPYDSGIKPIISPDVANLADAVLVADDKIVVVGLFDHYNGTPAPAIVRLLADGSIDPSFQPGAGAQWRTKQVDATHLPEIDSIRVQPDGKLLIAGNFEAYDNVPFPGIALLHSNGTPDLSFAPPVVLRDFATMVGSSTRRLDSAGGYNFLLSGSYSEPGRGEGRALVRFNTLPETKPALRIHTLHREANGRLIFAGVGVPGRAHTVEATTSLLPPMWTPIFTTTADAEGNLLFDDANAGSFPTRFYRVQYP